VGEPTEGSRPDADKPLRLAAAYSELQQLLLAGPDVADFLDQLARLSVELVPGSSCGITMRRDHQVVTAAHSDTLAMVLDEIQYGRGQGPCLQALHTGTRVEVPDLAADDRWPEYRTRALANGVASSVSLPLRINGDTIGALNLYSRELHTFTPIDVAALDGYARQAATALGLLLRHARQQEIQAEIVDGLAARTVIDQALGILMAQQKVTASEAFAALRRASQNGNRKLSDLAAEIVKNTTGQDPEPPRPFTIRD